MQGQLGDVDGERLVEPQVRAGPEAEHQGDHEKEANGHTDGQGHPGAEVLDVIPGAEERAAHRVSGPLAVRARSSRPGFGRVDRHHRVCLGPGARRPVASGAFTGVVPMPADSMGGMVVMRRPEVGARREGGLDRDATER